MKDNPDVPNINFVAILISEVIGAKPVCSPNVTKEQADSLCSNHVAAVAGRTSYLCEITNSYKSKIQVIKE